MANRAWTVTTASTFDDISKNAWATTLEDIPVASQDHAVMAAYHWADQVWCAVADTNSLARRILVLDKSAGQELTIFEPAASSWATGEEITAMVELNVPNLSPTMLVGTSNGRILQYPATVAGDASLAGTVYDYPANWRGVFAAERGEFGQRQERLEIHAGNNCQGRVKWTVRPKRSSGDTPPTQTGYIEANNAINTVGLSDKPDARFWEIEFSSEAVATADTETAWDIQDMMFLTGRTDKVS
jgi:hypothetical protein